MRDILWTIITIWFIWRIVEAFRGYTVNKRPKTNTVRNDDYSQQNSYSSTSQSKKTELKPDAGEYIDYEEVK